MMDFYRDLKFPPEIENSCITTIDSHTAGEITRLIVRGFDPVPGTTMTEKLAFVSANLDHLRCLLTREPRGSKEIMAALVTDSVTADARFGLIYMDARRYPYLCGHATIGAIATLAKTGFLHLGEGQNRVPVDTPSGLVEATAEVVAGRVTKVSLDMVPSFVHDTDVSLSVPGHDNIKVDLVCTGGFFALVETGQLGVEPAIENQKELARLGMQIIQAANEQLVVSHPLRPEVKTIDAVEFYDRLPGGVKNAGRGLVVYGESHVDRSPCGTGTTAKLTLLHHYGEIGLGENYTNYSPLGSSFRARIINHLRVGPKPAVVVRIESMAHLTGVHHFVVEDADPFPRGFLMG